MTSPRPRKRRTKAEIAAAAETPKGLHPRGQVLGVITEAKRHLDAAFDLSASPALSEDEQAQVLQYLGWEGRPSTGTTVYLDPDTGERVTWTPFASRVADAREDLFLDMSRTRSPEQIGGIVGITRSAVTRVIEQARRRHTHRTTDQD